MTAEIPAKRTFSIRTVAEQTGVHADTLRTWERRYRAVSPERTPGGTRRYSEQTMVRVQLLREATELGHPIGGIAPLPDDELRALVRTESRKRNPQGSPEAVVAAMFGAVEAGELAEMERLLGTAALAFSVRDLLAHVVQPFLAEVGERWEDGRMSIAQEHAVSASLRAVLLSLIRTYQRPSAAPRILLATLPGEPHEFGLLMLQLLAASSGIATMYLGTNMPPEEIAEAAKIAGVRRVALSFVHHGGDSAASSHLAALLTASDGHFEVWAGGRAAAAVACGVEHPRLHLFDDLAAFEQRLQLIKA